MLLTSSAFAGYIEDRGGKTVIHVTVFGLPDPSNTDTFNRGEVAGVRAFQERFPAVFAQRYRDKYKSNPGKYGYHNWDQVEVELQQFSGIKVEGVENDLLAIAGGVAPDVLYLNFRRSDNYIQNRFLYPLDKPEDDYMSSMTKSEIDFRVHPKLWPVINRKGPDGVKHVWALPYGGALGKVLLFRKDLFDAKKIPYPTADWTWEDLRAAAKTLTLDSNGDGVTDQYGFTFDPWDMEPGWSEAVWSYGGDIISADHTQTLIGSPDARQAWQLLYDMTFVDMSVPDANTSGQYGGDLFLAGMAAMIPMGHWSVPGYAEAGINFDVTVMPSGPGGRFTSVNSAGFVVAQASKQPDASWQFLKFVLSAPAQTRLAELGFACPVLQSVAESSIFLEQSIDIDQQVFLDSLEFAHMKPVFLGYDEWAAAVGDGMALVWRGEADLNTTLDSVVTAADEVLAQYK